MLYNNTHITDWQLLKLIRIACYKMLLSRANLRVLCYTNKRAISRPLRQQQQGRLSNLVKQIKSNIIFIITFKMLF